MMTGRDLAATRGSVEGEKQVKWVPMSFIDNYKRIQEQIGTTARVAGRNPNDVSIIAVSKTFPFETIQSAIGEGIRLFGENRIQEAKAKIPLLSGDFSFHLVGHLQSNKAKEAVHLFDLIHSIDSESTAARVDSEAAKTAKKQDILVQINASFEDTKSGVAPEEARALCEKIALLKNIRLRGLMTIGPNTDDPVKIRESFRMLRSLRDEIGARLSMELRELSMGMSSDFLIAVEEGATMVRIGTLIFGGRSEHERAQ